MSNIRFAYKQSQFVQAYLYNISYFTCILSKVTLPVFPCAELVVIVFKCEECFTTYAEVIQVQTYDIKYVINPQKQ